jgi:hypothetical protein
VLNWGRLSETDLEAEDGGGRLRGARLDSDEVRRKKLVPMTS